MLQLAAIEAHAAGRAVTESHIEKELAAADQPAPQVAMPLQAALSAMPELLPLAVMNGAGNGHHALGSSSPSSGHRPPVSRSHPSWTGTSAVDCEVGGMHCILCQACAKRCQAPCCMRLQTHERRRPTLALQVVVAAPLLPRPDQPGSWAVPALDDAPAAAAAPAAVAAAVKAAAPASDVLGTAASAASVEIALKDKLSELLAVAPEDIPVSAAGLLCSPAGLCRL